MIGKFLSKAVEIVNSPLDATEKLVARLTGEDDLPEDEKIISAPLKALADALKEVDEDDD